MAMSSDDYAICLFQVLKPWVQTKVAQTGRFQWALVPPPPTGRRLLQTPPPPPPTMMLNADIALVRYFGPGDYAVASGFTAPFFNGQVTGCTFRTCRVAVTEQFARAYAANNSLWKTDFEAVFKKMIEKLPLNSQPLQSVTP